MGTKPLLDFHPRAIQSKGNENEMAAVTRGVKRRRGKTNGELIIRITERVKAVVWPTTEHPGRTDKDEGGPFVIPSRLRQPSSVRGVNKMEGKAKSVCDVLWVQLVSSTFKNSCSLTPLRENPPFVGRGLSSDAA